MMELAIESNSRKDCPLSLSEMKEVFHVTLKKSGLPIKNGKIEISMALVSPSVIRRINREYRKKDEVTDILSFGEYPTSRKLLKKKKETLFLGELLICCADIKKSAKINKLSLKEEFSYIFAHGILHLLGFRHGAKMFAIQDSVARHIK